MSLTVDLRRLEPYVTGTGRTISESLPILRPEDRLVVRRPLHDIPSSQALRPASVGAVALEGLRGHVLGERVWQPWMLGPLGAAATLLGVYDLIPLRLGRVKAAILQRRLSVVRRRESVHVLTLLEGTKVRLAEEFRIPESRVHVLTPGVDDVMKPREATGDRPRYVLVVARASPHKNLAVLMDAWRQSGREIDLVLVLPPHDRDSRFGRQAVAYGATVLSNVNAHDLQALTSGAACVMSPSLEEGFGLPAIEAAAAGVALVASAIPAYQEIPVDGAILVPPRDTAAWVDAFHAVAAGQVRRSSLCANAPSWDDWRAGLAELLDHVRSA